MTLLVVGSTAFDTVETPHGTAKDCLGGSSTYFALAARLFTKVRLVSVVGQDFPAEHRQLLTQHGIDIAGLEEKPGKTFRWHGRYSADMNSRTTIDVQLNTFGSFQPKVPNSFQDSPFVFLANGAPATQLSVLQQMHAPKFIVADTMDLWIERERDGLLELLRKVHGVILNDAEAKQLTGESNLIKAGKKVLALGPSLVILKKGEHGCFLFSNYFHYAIPAYPTESVVDPTGAGDSFAGGFMGYLDGCDHLNFSNMKRALAYGTVTASLNVEGFGVSRIAAADRATVDRRYHELLQFVAP
ncbi:MAG: PfkB family carbohydrate kinase [Planctomycetota bacterium]|jgi:sugar/nucleoside kinase (ribokinase family)|nr:PfkB family carbohydrate kinase [Planctomycetota bacterium]